MSKYVDSPVKALTLLHTFFRPLNLIFLFLSIIFLHNFVLGAVSATSFTACLWLTIKLQSLGGTTNPHLHMFLDVKNMFSFQMLFFFVEEREQDRARTEDEGATIDETEETEFELEGVCTHMPLLLLIPDEIFFLLNFVFFFSVREELGEIL
ncbi:ORF1119 [White spot syndrome virus]|nr:ORF1119 [White spot syndrome virus]